MNLTKLEKINDHCWTLAGELFNQVQLYADENLLRHMDDKVLEQISNVAKLPGIVGPAITMPDAHWGYGFPIGGVAAFDADKGGIISAGGVGFDISCGIRCLRSHLSWNDISNYQEPLADALFAAIPAGVGKGGDLKVTEKILDEIMLKGARWAIQHGYGSEEDLNFIEENGTMKNANPTMVSALAKTRQLPEMGSLGSGNHYCEVQVVEKIFDKAAANAFDLFEGQVIISIHCGSRGLGHQIGTEYLIALAKEAKNKGIVLPDRELACAPILSDSGQRYLGAMNAGINCALANRQILAGLVRQAVQTIIPKIHLQTLYDVSHNTCKYEQHEVAGEKKWLYVHRKGATRAFGPNHPALPKVYQPVGQPVIIGGSMGTGSYILAGNDPKTNRAFSSASHGAGRTLSRRQALKTWSGKIIIHELQKKGILIRSTSMRGIAEEAPLAYKDVDRIALVSENAGLARRVALLRPKICIKG